MLTGQGKLHQQPVHGRIAVEFADELQQLLLGDGGRPEDGLAADPCNGHTHGISQPQKGNPPTFCGFELSRFTAWLDLGGAPEEERVCAAPGWRDLHKAWDLLLRMVMWGWWTGKECLGHSQSREKPKQRLFPKKIKPQGPRGLWTW